MIAFGSRPRSLTIAVPPGQRRHGIGRALLDATTAWAIAAGARRLVLEVAAENDVALELYERAGFRRCGRRPGYYSGQPRRDAWLLERALAPHRGGDRSGLP